ncbi:MAG TPA: diguanylate cyclase, partial [Armatimonadota bacterium]|nr:diguanylate cyclase [Armatimonadota bacterium]
LEQRVLRMFFFGNLTLSEIAEKLSISTPRSAYILRRSISKIKAGMDEHQRHETSLFLDALDAPEPAGDGPIYDKMTGVYAESYFMIRLAEECEECRQRGGTFALVLIDIQGVDDDCEPAMLSALGRIINGTMHGANIAAYLDQGRFGVLLYAPTPDGPTQVERLCEAIRQGLTVGMPDALVRLSGAGLVRCPQDGTTPDRLLRRAERALYAATAKARTVRR